MVVVGSIEGCLEDFGVGHFQLPKLCDLDGRVVDLGRPSSGLGVAVQLVLAGAQLLVLAGAQVDLAVPLAVVAAAAMLPGAVVLAAVAGRVVDDAGLVVFVLVLRPERREVLRVAVVVVVVLAVVPLPLVVPVAGLVRFVARTPVRVLVLTHVLLVLLVGVEAVAVAAAALLPAVRPGTAAEVEGIGPRGLVGDALLFRQMLVV